MLDLRWLFAFRKNFVALSTVLADMPVTFYSSQVTKVLLSHFWDETKSMILYKQFLPYLLLVLLTMVHFYRSL